MTLRLLWLVPACLLLGLAGCSKRHKIQVESDSCWTGTVNNDQYINDCGNASFRVIGSLHCVKVRLTTVNGHVRVRIDDNPWAETVDQYGYVQACE